SSGTCREQGSRPPFLRDDSDRWRSHDSASKAGNRLIVRGQEYTTHESDRSQRGESQLEQYARDCQQYLVIVTIEGVPSFEMTPIPSDDPEFIDRLLEQDEAFRRLAEERRREADEGRVSALADVRRRLDASS